jgi:peroxiredoxin
MAEMAEFKLHEGDVAPEFWLPGVDGNTYGLKSFEGKPVLVVTFWCNHCPYVQAWEGRLVELARKYEGRGVAFAAINSNDAVAYPADAWDYMVRRAREHHYPFPYLRDETQDVARAYGALVTPHPFVFDRSRHLVFQGRIDDNHSDPDRVKHRFLEQALEATLSGKPVRPSELPVQGCSVKWR